MAQNKNQDRYRNSRYLSHACCYVPSPQGGGFFAHFVRFALFPWLHGRRAFFSLKTAVCLQWEVRETDGLSKSHAHLHWIKSKHPIKSRSKYPYGERLRKNVLMPSSIRLLDLQWILEAARKRSLTKGPQSAAESSV
jgi:hypothetical protein